MFDWYTHLCDYYKVTIEEALKLGTRSSGRKPSLPGSETCQPVSGKTFEDIWEEKKRTCTQDIFDFYKDQGAWSAFRQCVRHKDLEQLHAGYINFLIQNGGIKSGGHICEYGAGVAPFTTTFLKYLNSDLADSFNLKITIVDVDCEHLNFAKYRLNKIKEDLDLKGIELNFITVEPDKLPLFNQKLDSLFCFEVLEHVPSPVDVINNIKESMHPGGYYIENFIKHDNLDDDDDGPDLVSARKERTEYYKIVNEYYNLINPSKEVSELNPSVTRIWQRNSL